MNHVMRWDELHGKNPLKTAEEMMEQNDNYLDGVINNVRVDSMVGTLELVKEDKKSILERIREHERMLQFLLHETAGKSRYERECM